MSDPETRQKRRGPARAALIAALGLLFVVLATFAFRLAIAEALLVAALSDRGLSPIALRVTALDLVSLTLEDLQLTDRLSAARLTVEFEPLSLLDGRIETLEIEGARLQLDLTGEGPPLGPLQALAGDEGGNGPPAPKPQLTFRDATLVADTPVGTVEAEIEGSARPGSQDRYEASLHYELTAPLGHLAGAFDLALAEDGTIEGSTEIEDGTVGIDALGLRAEGVTGQLRLDAGADGLRALSGSLATSALRVTSDERAGLELRFALEGERLTFDAAGRFEVRGVEATASGTLAGLTAAPELDLTATLEAADLSRLPLPAHPLVPERGAGSLSLALSGVLPATAGDQPATYEQRLLGAELQGRARMSLSALSRDGSYQDAGIDLDLAGSLGEQTLALRLAGPFSLQAAQIAPELARALGGSEWLAEALAGGPIWISAAADALTADFHQDETGYRGTLEAASLAAGLAGARGDLTGRLEITLSDDLALRALRSEALEVALRDLSVAGTFGLETLKAKGALDVEPARIALDGWQVEAKAVDVAEARIAAASLATSATLAADRIELTGLILSLDQASMEGLVAEQVGIEGGLSGSLASVTGSLALTASGAWDLPDGTWIRGARLTAPLRLEADAGALSLALEKEASLKIRSLAREESALPLGVSLRLSDGSLRLPWGQPSEATYAMILRPLTGGVDWPWRVTLLPAADDPVELLVTPLRLRIEGEGGSGALTTEVARIADEVHAVAAEAIAVTARLSGTAPEVSGTLSVASLRHLGEPSLLPPASLDGSFERRGDTLAFDGRLGGHALWQSGKVAASHDLSSGRGTARLGPLSLTFTPGSEAARALAPLLGGLTPSAGTAEASAALSWDAGHLDRTASLALSGIAAAGETLALKGLSADLRLDDLLAPSSPPGQAFSIERIERPAEISAVAGRLQLLPGRPPRIHLETVGFESSGARLRVDDTLLDPGSASNALVLEVERLDLEALTRVLDIEGVSGTGILAGRVPMAVDGRRLLITDGLLKSQAPGIVRYRSKESLALLKGIEAGDGLDSVKLFDDPFRLTLLALTNFHYDSLTLGVTNSPEGKANLKLGLKGKNPELLSGYPFDLNVNLDTNLVPLLDALDDGLVISRDLLPRSWRFGR